MRMKKFALAALACIFAASADAGGGEAHNDA